MTLSFSVDGSSVSLAPQAVAIAGFTGRNREAVEHHLAELRELGVPTPARTPCYYPAPPSLLVQTPSITVTHGETSGEAEAVLIVAGSSAWLTLGSDHTHRAAETLDIPLSKVATPKPIAHEAWTFESVKEHLDRIELRSWIRTGATETLYQEGTLTEFVPIDQLAAAAPFVERPRDFAVFGGTLPAIGGIRPADAFRAELCDPVTGRVIALEYSINVLTLRDDPEERQQ